MAEEKKLTKKDGTITVRSNELLAQLLDIAESYMTRKYDHWNDDYDAYRLKKKFREKLEAYRSSVSG